MSDAVVQTSGGARGRFGLWRACKVKRWIDWYDRDETGRITQAGIDTGDHSANVAVTTLENIEEDDIAKFNAVVEADTRLMAAAPLLLEKAEAVLAGLNARIANSRGDHVPVFDGIADLWHAINFAKGLAQAGPDGDDSEGGSL